MEIWWPGVPHRACCRFEYVVHLLVFLRGLQTTRRANIWLLGCEGCALAESGSVASVANPVALQRQWWLKVFCCTVSWASHAWSFEWIGPPWNQAVQSHCAIMRSPSTSGFSLKCAGATLDHNRHYDSRDSIANAGVLCLLRNSGMKLGCLLHLVTCLIPVQKTRQCFGTIQKIYCKI